jgi:hypothetical protein
MFEPHTTVIGGPLARQMRRAAASRAGECRRQILTLPLLAARLAGIPRCYGNYTCWQLEKFVPRCDQ